MRAHYITDNPSGYRGRLFPLDNSASFSLSTLCLLSMLINTTLKTQRKKRAQLWGCNSSNAALMGALSISLKRWQMKNKRWLLLVMLINNRPFEPGASHAPIVCLEDGGAGGTVTGSWEHHANSGMRWQSISQGWAQSLALTGTQTGMGC